LNHKNTAVEIPLIGPDPRQFGEFGRGCLDNRLVRQELSL